MDMPPVINDISPSPTKKGYNSKYIIISLLILLIITIVGSAITIAILLSKDDDNKEDPNGNKEETSQECDYNNKTYKSGEGFPSTDGCNSCSCVDGEVVCTLMACLDNTSTDSTPFESEDSSTISIFLVAEGDNGVSGTLVGCGDSLVEVKVEADPTTDLVKEALTKLFAIKEEYYGESGLKNALYKSDLAVDYIDIQEDALKVYLAGAVVSAGTCDTPRIIGQIEETINGFEASYPVIAGKDIEIYVNGQLIEDVLSLK